jgi:hypothetical protein
MEFKVLTSFVNGYKRKLMVGKLSANHIGIHSQQRDPARLYATVRVDECDEDIPLSLSALNSMK